MKQIAQNDIIQEILKYPHIWDISNDFAKNSLSHFQFDKCLIYSYGHYKCIYTLLSDKLKTLPSKTDKLAYLDCIIMNYKLLQNNDSLDLAISLISGSFIGVSFLDISNDIILKSISLIFLVFLTISKISTLTNTKWKFYTLILEQLKADILNN